MAHPKLQWIPDISAFWWFGRVFSLSSCFTISLIWASILTRYPLASYFIDYASILTRYLLAFLFHWLCEFSRSTALYYASVLAIVLAFPFYWLCECSHSLPPCFPNSLVMRVSPLHWVDLYLHYASLDILLFGKTPYDLTCHLTISISWHVLSPANIIILSCYLLTPSMIHLFLIIITIKGM